MTITHNFEERAWVTRDDGVYEWDQEEVRKLLDHARQLEAMLKKNEWPGEDEYGFPICLECGPQFMDKKHSTDCQLAKLLGEE